MNLNPHKRKYQEDYQLILYVYRWAFRVLSVNKDAQRQIQDEIDRVVGERDVTWDDRHK